MNQRSYSPFRSAKRSALTRSTGGGVVTLNGGGDLFLVGSRFGVSCDHAGMLLEMLPPIVHIEKERDQAALRWCVERMQMELHNREAGSSLFAQHLDHMMLIQILRMHLSDAERSGGWLRALADKQIGAALRAMHADPGRRWILQNQAHKARGRAS
ncbi:MAG TPA: cupin domain-containing protein [Gammaproteobacteria bacterium]